MLIRAEEAIQKANHVLRQCGTRNADRIARELGLIVMPRDFSRQKGAYMVIERNRYIFINKHLDPVMHDIVLLHEIGHDCLHRREAIQVGGLQEFNIFDMRNQRMEYEANMFAAQIALPDDEILEYIYGGYDVGQIARIMSYTDFWKSSASLNEMRPLVCFISRMAFPRRRWYSPSSISVS